MSVTPVSADQVISEKPFLDPTARPTGPVRLPAELVDDKGSESTHEKKKSHKSKSKHKSDQKLHRHSDRHSDKSSDRHSNRFDTLALAGEFPLSSSMAPTGIKDIPGLGIKSMASQPGMSHTASHATGQVSQDPLSTG